MAETDLSGVDLSGSLLHDCNLAGDIFDCADLHGARLVDCRLRGVVLTNVKINGDKKAVVTAVDDFNPVVSGAPASLQEVYRLSSGKSATRRYTRELPGPGDTVAIPAGGYWMGTDALFAERYERPARGCVTVYAAMV